MVQRMLPTKLVNNDITFDEPILPYTQPVFRKSPVGSQVVDFLRHFHASYDILRKLRRLARDYKQEIPGIDKLPKIAHTRPQRRGIAE